jgi:hypothetical protein
MTDGRVVIFRLPNMRPEKVNRYLRILIEEHRDALCEGAIVSVNAGRICVRMLPVER